MAILCQPPGKRYVVYALGVLAVVFVGIFSILYIMDGAPGEARGMWSLCVAMAILLLIVTIFAGNIRKSLSEAPDSQMAGNTENRRQL